MVLQYSQLQYYCHHIINRGRRVLTCHQEEAQHDHVQAQGGGDDQAQQQGQVSQMEEEVVGLLPLLA